MYVNMVQQYFGATDLEKISFLCLSLSMKIHFSDDHIPPYIFMIQLLKKDFGVIEAIR